MAAMNSNVLACSYAISGVASSELTLKVSSQSGMKFPVIRAQQAKLADSKEITKNGIEGRRVVVLCLAAAVISTTSSATSANAGVIEDYLEKSKANKELNDKKRLATSGANFARAFTVQFGSCNFPYNFTGCQDLAKTKNVKFISDDLEVECEGKDKYKCGSNVFWKWGK